MEDRIKEAIQSARDKNKGKITPSKDIYESIYLAGIKEVVEEYKEDNPSNYKKYEAYWQSKLNKWGVK